jgi:hypothetical protein
MSQRGYSEDDTDAPFEWWVTAYDARRKAWLAFAAGAVIFGALGAAAGAAFGQVPEPRMSLEPGAGDCFAVVAIHNRSGAYNLAETLETTAGPVTLQYRTVWGHNATDDDEVTVIALPDGVVADPDFMKLPDGETGHVCLIEWVGL